MLNQFESLEGRRLLAGTGVISGSVYTDLNASGTHEAGEAGIKNARLYLDTNNNRTWDSRTETAVLTDKRGQFQFTALAAGTYRLREVGSASVANTAPQSGWFRIKLSEGQNVVRRMFGNAIVAQIPNAIDLTDQVAVQNYLATGSRTGGLWNMAGVTSSAAQERPVRNVLLDLTASQLGVVDFDDYTHLTGQHALGVIGSFVYNGGVNIDAQPPARDLGLENPQPTTPTPKSVALEDFRLTHHDHSLLSAKSYLLGDKNVIRSQGLYTVIDHYHQYGIEYKREFLRLARDY